MVFPGRKEKVKHNSLLHRDAAKFPLLPLEVQWGHDQLTQSTCASLITGVHVARNRENLGPVPCVEYLALTKPRDVRQSDIRVVCWHCSRSTRGIGDLSAVTCIHDLLHHPARTRNPVEKTRIAKVYPGFWWVKLRNLCSCSRAS